MFWIPRYLNEVRGADISIIGRLFWIPFLGLGISNVIGGFLSDRILKRTGNLNLSRKIVMGSAALLTLSVLLIKYAQSAEMAIFLITIAVFAHGLWITNYITTISDIFGKTITSTVIGLSGTGGALSALLLNPAIGMIVSRYSYNPVWFYSGIMYSVAFLAFLILIPNIRLLKRFE
jgi:ACS family hexuronate transporter-like MFS transporter